MLATLPHAPASTWVTQVPVVRSVTRSIRASGLWKTSTGKAYENALRREGGLLRAYLAVRLRSHERGRAAYEMVREALDEGHGSELFEEPGARARLLLLARRIAHVCDDLDPVGAPLEAAPWDAAPLGSPRGYGALLDRVRRAVSEPELERLELSLAHCLEDFEVAHVLEESIEDVQRARATSLAWLRMELEHEPLARGVELSVLVRDALRVLPPPASDLSEEDSVPPPLAAGAVVGDRFVIEECVGGGAFGHVYRARDVHVPSHVVALKMLHRPAKTDAAREGAIAELSRIASAFHPSLVQLKEHGWFSDRLWFVMPWYRGETLAARLERGPLSVREAASLLAPVARALAALHEAGIRHQDVKPDNILLAEIAGQDELVPVLLDLGVAARSEELAVAGTPMYFAPEMAQRILEPEGRTPISHKADVFALAMTILHALEPPDPSEPDFDGFLRERAEGGPALPPSRRVAPLRRQLSRWLARAPEERPSAVELGRELEELAGSAVSPRRRALGLAGGIVLATICGLGALSLVRVWSWPSASPRPSPSDVTRSHGDAAQLHALGERLRVAEERAAALESRLQSAHEGITASATAAQTVTAAAASDTSAPDATVDEPAEPAAAPRAARRGRPRRAR